MEDGTQKQGQNLPSPARLAAFLTRAAELDQLRAQRESEAAADDPSSAVDVAPTVAPKRRGRSSKGNH